MISLRPLIRILLVLLVASLTGCAVGYGRPYYHDGYAYPSRGYGYHYSYPRYYSSPPFRYPYRDGDGDHDRGRGWGYNRGRDRD